MHDQHVSGMDTAPAQGGDAAAGGAWAGAVAAVFALASLVFHAPALAVVSLVPRLLDLVSNFVVQQSFESGLPAVERDPFAAARGALADVGPPTLAALGLAVGLAVLVLFGGVGLTFGRRFGRRVLRVALALEAARALGWAFLVTTSLGAAARAGAAAFDVAGAPAGLRGGGPGGDGPGLTEFVTRLTEPLATWGPALLQAAVVAALFAWSGSRAARLRTGELTVEDAVLS